MAAQTGERPARFRPLLAKRGDRYGLLLLLLVCSYVLSAFTTGRYAGGFESLLFVLTLLLALRTSRVRRRTMHLIMGIAVVGSVTAAGLAIGHATNIGLGILSIWTALILLLTVGVILRRVLTMGTASLQSIFGAVSAYMIIGLMFASIYAAMFRLQSVPFFATGSPTDTRTFQYFSFTTLTTLGYGDFTAGTNAGRAVAVMEALGGQIFLATLVARLVAAYRAPRRSDQTQPANPDQQPTGQQPTGQQQADQQQADQRQAGQHRVGQDLPGNGNPRRGNALRPQARRPPLVKWRSARRR